MSDPLDSHVTLVAHEVGTPGGMERQLTELARGLLARGWRVTVVARECRLADHPRLDVVRVRGPRRPFSVAYLWFFVFGSLAVARHRAGLVHTTGAVVVNRADVSTVHFCHRAFQAALGTSRASRRSPAYRANAWVVGVASRLAERYCFRPRITRRLVAVSEGLAGELRGFFPSVPVSVIPNGVDGEEFSPDRVARVATRARLGIEAGDPVAVFVGGDWERKGLGPAIEGVAATRRWRLIVVGEGDVATYQALAERSGAPDRVHFVGGTTDTAAYYAAADVFLFPTAYEAFALVTLEAAAAGLVLLVSRVNGAEDILVDDYNGWFIDRDAEMIAERLGALEDHEVREAMGAAARAQSARFGWDGVVAAYDKLYREMASR